jgi:hypothetical protein
VGDFVHNCKVVSQFYFKQKNQFINNNWDVVAQLAGCGGSVMGCGGSVIGMWWLS